MRNEKFEKEIVSALTHFIGLLLAIAGLTLMVIFASLKGTAWHVVGFSIFGTSLILLYLASSLYHYTPISRSLKNKLKTFDHAMIYVLIAGTYTPICLTAWRGAWGWSLFGVIWGLAIIGIVIQICKINIGRWTGTGIYILMGWLIVVAFWPLTNTLSGWAWFWLASGGIAYTIGAIFYGFEKPLNRQRYFTLHEVFHLFVILGSFCHFWLMLKYLIP